MNYIIRLGKDKFKGSYLRRFQITDVVHAGWTSYRHERDTFLTKELAQEALSKITVPCRLVKVLTSSENSKKIRANTLLEIANYLLKEKMLADNPQDGIGFPKVVDAYWTHLESKLRKDAEDLLA